MSTSWNDSLTKKFINPIITYRPSESTKILLSNILFIVAALSIIPYLILIWKVYKTHKTGGLILTAYYFGLFISTTWLLYGMFVLRNFIVIISSLLLIIVKATLIFLIYRSRSSNSESEEN